MIDSSIKIAIWCDPQMVLRMTHATQPSRQPEKILTRDSGTSVALCVADAVTTQR